MSDERVDAAILALNTAVREWIDARNVTRQAAASHAVAEAAYIEARDDHARTQFYDDAAWGRYRAALRSVDDLLNESPD